MFIPYCVEVDTPRRPYVTYALIGINTIALGVTLSLPPEARERLFMTWGFVPEEFGPFAFVKAITASFLHAGPLHFLANMYFLFLFGRSVESGLGHALHGGLYAVWAIVAALVQRLATPAQVADIPMIGASGAVAGVLGAFVAIYPRAEVRSIYLFGMLGSVARVIELPAFLVLGGYFLLQVIFALGDTGMMEVAFAAHVGGFLAGLTFVGCSWYRENMKALVGRRLSAHLARTTSERALEAQREGRLDEAIALYEEIETPRPPAAEIGKGYAHLARGEEAEARACAAAAFRAYAEERDAGGTIAAGLLTQRARGTLAPEQSLGYARALAKLNRPGRALALLHDALSRGTTGARRDFFLHEVGRILHERCGDAGRARRVFEVLLRDHPDSRWVDSVAYFMRTSA